MTLKATKEAEKFLIKSFPVGPLGCNCSLVYDPASGESALVDPGDEFEKIKKTIETAGVTVKYILHTHAHFDHIGASEALHRWTQAPLLLHPGDEFLWENVQMQGKFFQMNLKPLPRWTENLEDEKEFQIGKHKLKTLFTPGHTPGSCCFVLGDTLFSGDTLFQGSIGRTDLWGGDHELIVSSIKDRLYRLDEDTRVICGHGPETKIGVEMRSNAFVRL
jgi:glyoxylase-like metal-dependent hydrolase (beta-lactamase superfamily II)